MANFETSGERNRGAPVGTRVGGGKAHIRRLSVIALALAAALALPRVAFATTSITINTSMLTPGTAATLDFVLLDGDFAANNSVTIASFATDGVLGANDCTLGCATTPPYTVDDGLVLGQFRQNLMLGTYVSFTLDFTTNFSGSDAPDRFTLNLLDSNTNLTLVDTELDFLSDPVPAQDALLLIDLKDGATVQQATRVTPITPGGPSVPEPSTLLLSAVALVALAWRGMRPARAVTRK